MTGFLETAIFLVALLVVVLALTDLFSSWWRAVNQSTDLERLRTLDDDEVEEARERTALGINWRAWAWTGAARRGASPSASRRRTKTGSWPT